MENAGVDNVQGHVRTGWSEASGKLSQLILTAPDVDKEVFESAAARIGKVAKGASLYASNSDRALMIFEWLRGRVPRADSATVPPGQRSRPAWTHRHH